MSRLGVGVALLFLPIAVLAGSMGFTVLPILWVGSSLNTVDNAFSYSINQSAKESLYVPTTRDEKYKAKAFIDMFVQRFAKAVAVGSEPRDHNRVYRLFQHPLALRFHHSDYHRLDLRGALCGPKV